jgi:hypothetical protein
VPDNEDLASRSRVCIPAPSRIGSITNKLTVATLKAALTPLNVKPGPFAALRGLEGRRLLSLIDFPFKIAFRKLTCAPHRSLFSHFSWPEVNCRSSRMGLVCR